MTAKRITIKTANEWRGMVGKVPVNKIAADYGVDEGTVYYHTNKRHAERRREQWRRCQAKRRAERRHVTSQ